MFKRILLVDGNHLIYRAYYKFSGLRTLDGKQTSIIYGAPYILESIIRRLGADKVFVVFDHSRSKFRTNLLPDYKKRDSKLGDNKEDFYDQRDELMKLLMAFGITVFQPKGYEADDVIGYLTQQYYKMGWEVVIVSGDKDFVQLINKRVLLYNVNKGKMVDESNCYSNYSYTPKQCVEYLSICGDSSDKIPGYRGMGPKTAEKLFNNFGSVKKFLKSTDTMGKINKEVLSGVYDLNRKLIDIMYFVRKELNPKEMEPINKAPEISEKKLKGICRENQINSFLKVQFFKTYQNLYNGK